MPSSVEKTYPVGEQEAKASGIASLRVGSNSATFLDAGGKEVGSLNAKWTAQGAATATLAAVGGRPTQIEVRFTKDTKGNTEVTGTLGGSPFSISLSADYKVTARTPENGIKVDPDVLKLLKSSPGQVNNHEPNPPTVPFKQSHEKATTGKDGTIAQPEFSAGECALAILCAGEIMAATAGIGGFWAGVALGYGCRP